MFRRSILQTTLVTLIGLAWLSSGAPATRAEVACGTWVSKGDSRVPLIMVDPGVLRGTGSDCSASFYLRNSMNVDVYGLFAEDGFTMELNGYAPPGTAYRWTPPIGHVDNPSTSMLMPGTDAAIKVIPYDPAMPTTVTIQGTPNIHALEFDLLFFALDAGLAFAPTKCGQLPKGDLAKALLKGGPEVYGILATTTDLYAKGEGDAAYQELSNVLDTVYEKAGDLFDSMKQTCFRDLFKSLARNLGKKLIDRAFLAWDIEKAFLDWWAPLMGTYVLYYGGTDPVITLEYTPLKVPATPTPPPPSCFAGPTLFDPPSGRTFWAKNTILRWKGYQLAPGDVYEVRVWGQDGGMKLRADTADYNQKTGESKLDVNDLYSWGEGIYFWTVRVRGSNGNYVTCEGTPFWFRLNPRPDSGTTTPQIITPVACPTSWGP